MKNTDRLVKDLAPKKFGKLGVLWTILLIIVSLLRNCCLHRPGHKRANSN